MIINSKQLGDLIVRRRLRRGWSQTKLAKTAGISRATVSNAERAIKSPIWDTAMAIINALGITSAELEGGKDA